MLEHTLYASNKEAPILKKKLRGSFAKIYKKNSKLKFYFFIILLIYLNLHIVYAQVNNNNNVNIDNDNNNNNYELHENKMPATTTKTDASIKTKTTQNFNKPVDSSNGKPNIVIILVDDLGFNDFSFHGSNQIITPNIDALAYNGIILNRHYTPNLCTPSRATLLTGKYPTHTGTQHFVIINDEPWGLPLKERLMPEIFREHGYSTNLIGKWHLGFYKKEMTPTMRGFDYHYGYYSGYIDYWDHTLKMLDRNYSTGLDFRRNLKTWYAANGSYATDEFTKEAVNVIETHDIRKPLFLVLSHLAVHTGNEDNPLQAPEEEIAKFSHITDEKRRIYAGMVSRLDHSVGKTIKALANKGILNNTIVLLYSDNGAPTLGMHANGGSNYPFKGQKESPWEGGLRSAGLIYSPLLKKQHYVSNQLIHVADWLPTLAKAAKIELPADLKLDGIDQWDSLSQQLEPKPRSLLHALDDSFGYYAYMRDGFKIVNGTTVNGKYDTWLGELSRFVEEEDPLKRYYVQTVLASEVQATLGSSNTNLNVGHIEKLRAQATHRCPETPFGIDATAKMYRCQPLKAPCLFNIEEDPCERFNLAEVHPDLLSSLEGDVKSFRKTAVPPARLAYPDPNSNPALHNGTWEWWDDLDKNVATTHITSVSMSISVCSSLMWYRF